MIILFKTKFSSTYFRRATGEEVESAKVTRKDKNKNKDKKDAVPPIKPLKKRQNSVDYLKMKNSQITGNTTFLNLLTVHETEGERTKTISDNWANTSRFGLRHDKGKDFLNSMTDRTGVSGIIPSGIITSKTDRFLEGNATETRDYSPLTSNDSYLLPPISKDTDAPFMAFKNRERRDRDREEMKNVLNTDATPDLSPIGRLKGMEVSPLEIPERDEESFDLPTFKQHHRRVNSMQHFPSSTRAISLMEAITSPKVQESAKIEYPQGLQSPTSDASNAVQCLICFDNLPDAVFMECGHGGNYCVSICELKFCFRCLL